MDINIKTKYNIGDTVYAADLWHEFYPNSKSYTITDILLRGSINKACIDYEIEQDGYIESAPESWLFPTYEECAKWCDKRNKI